MPKTKELLQALLDREAIRDLPLRYCDCVWRDDIEGLVKLFAPTGEFVIAIGGQETVATGHAALREVYRKGLAIGPRPFIHNHVVELQGAKKGRGRCYLDLHSIHQNMQFIGAGHYADTYVKSKGEWKFQRRHFTALRIDSNPVATMAEEPTPLVTRPRRARRATPRKPA
jgi:hypothetical protein